MRLTFLLIYAQLFLVHCNHVRVIRIARRSFILAPLPKGKADELLLGSTQRRRYDMQIDTICTKCGKIFERNTNVKSTMAAAVGRNSESLCYSCALKSLVGKRAPEEGDFNAAHIISCEISDKELAWLMEDLRAVEEGRSIREPYEDDREYIDICPRCGCYYCVCDPDDEPDELYEEEPEEPEQKSGPKSWRDKIIELFLFGRKKK